MRFITYPISATFILISAINVQAAGETVGGAGTGSTSAAGASTAAGSTAAAGGAAAGIGAAGAAAGIAGVMGALGLMESFRPASAGVSIGVNPDTPTKPPAEGKKPVVTPAAPQPTTDPVNTPTPTNGGTDQPGTDQPGTPTPTPNVDVGVTAGSGSIIPYIGVGVTTGSGSGTN